MDALDLSVEDRVIDVACGPGIIACALAGRVHSVTGTDVVPAMLEQAARLQQQRSLPNIAWKLGAATELPFADDAFSVVVTRYSFHHFLDPEKALEEMTRVCRPGGRIAVADVTPDSGKALAYDEMEKLRDSSHVRVASVQQLRTWGQRRNLSLRKELAYGLDIDLDGLLAASFPPPGNAAKIRQKMDADIGHNRLGFNARLHGKQIVLHLPISMLVWNKPA